MDLHNESPAFYSMCSNMTWFQSTRALYISAALTTDEVLQGLMVVGSDQLVLDELVPGVRWMKRSAPFSLFIGFCTFCGHLRWEWVGGKRFHPQTRSDRHPLMTSRASFVSKVDWKGQKVTVRGSVTCWELSRDALLWFSILWVWTYLKLLQRCAPSYWFVGKWKLERCLTWSFSFSYPIPWPENIPENTQGLAI